MDFDAVILAGGQARRMGGADKPASLVGGRRLVDVALAAVADADRIVVVGPQRDLPADIRTTREDPPFAGPVAALRAGLAALDDLPDDRAVAVLAADLPFLTAAHLVALARARSAAQAPVALAVDDEGRRQYLVGVWRADALRQALAAAGESMRSMIPDEAVELPLPGIADVDTPADLEAARRLAGPAGTLTTALAGMGIASVRTAPPADALGGVLAEPLRAALPFPAFDTAAMDGFAVRGEPPWHLVGTPIRAGHRPGALVADGTAAVIATGAPLPDGADRVVRVEEVAKLPDGSVTPTSQGRDDTRRQGDSWTTGDLLAEAGTTVDAALVGTAHAAGVARISVRGPLRGAAHLRRRGRRDRRRRHRRHRLTPGAGVVGAHRHPCRDRRAPARYRRRRARCRRARPHAGRTRRHHRRDRARHRRSPAGGTRRGRRGHPRRRAPDPPGRLADRRRPPDGGTLLGLGGNPVAALAGAALCAPPLRDALLAAAPAPADEIAVDNAAELAHPTLWRVVPIRPQGAGRWLGAAVTSTAEPGSLIGARGIALLAPQAGGPVRRLI
ncbi:NTP transferase domain-containing protein [Gordonia sp. X0973]|nr:NTP transferase domain-containing protein [Gordonia sp. X0973]QKT06923.1 NTP transferase domain-containing protein [Gordonia sp. X0973]